MDKEEGLEQKFNDWENFEESNEKAKKNLKIKKLKLPSLKGKLKIKKENTYQV
jgi:hypothetical protein